MDGYYAPYRKGRWVICQAYPLNYNDNYRKLSELSLLSNALNEIEKESGVQFGSALEEYMDAGKTCATDVKKSPLAQYLVKEEILKFAALKKNMNFDSLIRHLKR